ncbi:MAG: methyltransferase [Ruminococcus sp.]|nr:methyltransferase [Ruminococcus sp.]MBR2304488.1 methyltransferase [Ruminococcus sp.]
MNYNDLTYEQLGERYKVCISTEHRFGTDAFLLADFAGARHKDICADLCTGSGIIALLLDKKYSPKKTYAVEIQKKAYDQLCLSIEASKAEDTMIPVNADLKEWRCDEELDLITCNPPYKLDNTGAKNESEAVSIARHEMMCTIGDVCKAAKRNLKFGGRLCVCNRPERLCDIITAMKENGIEPKRLRTVHKNPNCAPWLVLVEGKKGAKAFLNIERPLFVRTADGGISEEVQQIYLR